MTVSVRRDAPPAGSDAGRGRGPAPQTRSGRLLRRLRKGGLPYLFLLPALILELLVHFVPMVFGIVISFKQLTLFFIRNWTGAPWAGWANYRITMPSLRSVNQVLILVLFLWTFNDFTTPFVLFGASAPSPADVISIHIYNASFINWNFGEGSAMSVLMLVFLLLVTAVYLIGTSRRRKNA